MNARDHRSSDRRMQPIQYFDHGLGSPTVKILPGEYFVTRRRLVIVTVVGSCVCACIRDRIRGIGGMNHFMLPPVDTSSSREALLRYGEHAMETLLAQLSMAGAHRAWLEAKVFGGGLMDLASSHKQAGEHNAEFLTDYLEKAGIRIAGRDLLGAYPRKVYFFPKDGRVLVKTLKTQHNNTIVERERSLRLHLAEIDASAHPYNPK